MSTGRVSGCVLAKLSEKSDLEIIVCPPTSTLKLKLKIDTNNINMYIKFKRMFMAFRLI
jgi:hypothetical protein